MPQMIDLTGKTFGLWKVLKFSHKDHRNQSFWICQCSCEAKTTKTVVGYSLRKGGSLSCGCDRPQKISKANKGNNNLGLKHGHNRRGKPTTTYKTWQHMKERCLNPNVDFYENYGGRGIKVCERWLNSFENFLEDMGEKPPGYSIERIDVNGNYEKSNCCYIKLPRQAYNKTVTHWVTFRGETKSLAEWIDILQKEGTLKLTYKGVADRIRRGWTYEEAFLTPPLQIKSKS